MWVRELRGRIHWASLLASSKQLIFLAAFADVKEAKAVDACIHWLDLHAKSIFTHVFEILLCVKIELFLYDR